MKKFTLGMMFRHPGYKRARFILCAFDDRTEVFHAFNTLTNEVIEFHFADMDDCRKVKPGATDSILY